MEKAAFENDALNSSSKILNQNKLFNLLPIFVVTAAFLIFSYLPSFFSSAGIFKIPLLLLLTISACVLILAPGLAVFVMMRAKVPSSLSLGIVILGSGMSGWLLFWAWFVHPLVGVCASLALTSVAMLILSYKSSGLVWGKTLAPVVLPVLVSTTVCFGYLCLAGDHGGLEYGDNLVCGRYWAVMDNAIPRLFANALINDKVGLKPFLIADWHSSDRPPLQTGMIMVAYPFVKEKAKPLAYLVISSAVNILWILGFWGFLRALGLSERKILQTLILLILVGAIFVNSVYTWPKMLAAALAFTAGTALLIQVRDYPRGIRLFVFGGAIALSLLAHGAAIFALMGYGTLFWVRRKEWQLQDIFVTAAIAALIYLPWAAYQKNYDPPGDRLIKWHLAGLEPVDESRPPFQTIFEEYQKAGFHGFITNKIHNVRMLLGDPTDWDGVCARGYAQPGWNDTFIGHLRQFFVLRFGPAPILLLVGLPLLLVRKVRQAIWFKPLLGFFLPGLLFFVLLEFGSTPSSSTWLCHAPYTALILWCALCALAITEFGDKCFYIFLPFHLIVFVSLWGWNIPMWSAGPPPYWGKPDIIARLAAAMSLLTLVVIYYKSEKLALKTVE